MAMEYFCCYHSYRKTLRNLSDGEVGRLMMALLDYSEAGTEPELNGREKIAFDFIAADIDRAKEKYNDKCAKNRENVSRRWRTEETPAPSPAGEDTEDTTVYDGVREDTKHTKAKANAKANANAKAKENGFDLLTSFAGQNTELLAALRGFEEMRKKLKKPMTERAKELMLKDLVKLAGDDQALQIAILDQSVKKGWQGVFPLREDYDYAPPRAASRSGRLETGEKIGALQDLHQAYTEGTT